MTKPTPIIAPSAVPKRIINAITQYGDSRADDGLASGPALGKVIAAINEHYGSALRAYLAAVPASEPVAKQFRERMNDGTWGKWHPYPDEDVLIGLIAPDHEVRELYAAAPAPVSGMPDLLSIVAFEMHSHPGGESEGRESPEVMMVFKRAEADELVEEGWTLERELWSAKSTRCYVPQISLPSPQAPDTSVAPCSLCNGDRGMEKEFSSTSGAWMPCPKCLLPSATDISEECLKAVAIGCTHLDNTESEMCSDCGADLGDKQEHKPECLTIRARAALLQPVVAPLLAAPAPTERAVELPPLPEPEHDYITRPGFTAGQMQDYARAALAARQAPIEAPKEAITGGRIENPEDAQFYRFWYSHMQRDQMTGALADIKHSTARYIWDAARPAPDSRNAALKISITSNPAGEA